MIGTALLLQAAELVGWSGLYVHLKHRNAQKLLIHGNRPQPSRIPLLDEQIRKIAGSPSAPKRFMAKRMTTMVRKLVNTRAFEYVVVGLLNEKSRMHPRLKKQPKITIL